MNVLKKSLLVSTALLLGASEAWAMEDFIDKSSSTPVVSAPTKKKEKNQKKKICLSFFQLSLRKSLKWGLLQALMVFLTIKKKKKKDIEIGKIGINNH